MGKKCSWSQQRRIRFAWLFPWQRLGKVKIMMIKSRSTSMVPITKRRGENSKGVRRTTHDLDQQNIDINLDQQIIDTNWSSRIGEENIASTLSWKIEWSLSLNPICGGRALYQINNLQNEKTILEDDIPWSFLSAPALTKNHPDQDVKEATDWLLDLRISWDPHFRFSLLVTWPLLMGDGERHHNVFAKPAIRFSS